MAKWLAALQSHGAAWPFLQPVNGEEVVDYYDVVKNPMGQFTLSCRLISGYVSVDFLDRFWNHGKQARAKFISGY